jgi:hypothetical protein
MKLNVVLNDEATKRFEAVKKHIGVTTNISTLQYVISREYGRIQRSKMQTWQGIKLTPLTKQLLGKYCGETGEKAKDVLQKAFEQFLEKRPLMA